MAAFGLPLLLRIRCSRDTFRTPLIAGSLFHVVRHHAPVISMETSVEFESSLFRPFLPEKSQVNPHIYGAELAFWLARKLADHGVITSYPNYEDWGWFLEYQNDSGDEYWLCCGNREGTGHAWLCYLSPKAKSLFERKKADPEKALPLLQALREVLKETPEVHRIIWGQ